MDSAPFKFKLERVRRLRADAEDAARLRLAGALAEVDESEAWALETSRRLDAAARMQSEAAMAPLSGTDLVALQAWRERLELATVAAHAEVDRRVGVADARRAEALDASRDRQALDKLEERQRAAHALAAERAQTALLDEIAQTQHLRRGA